MAGPEDFNASNWEVYKDSFAPPPETTRRAKPWERASRPASAPRLAGQNIWKRPGVRSHDNKENEEAAQLELGKGGAGMRKRAKIEGGREDIRDAMWLEACDDIEKVGSKEEKGREYLGRGDLEMISVTARKRTNADHVITPRKPLRKRASYEMNIVLSPVKMVVSPEKSSRRKSARKSLRRVSVAEGDVEAAVERRHSLKQVASFDTSGLGDIDEIPAKAQATTNAAEESFEGTGPQITANEGTQDSLSEIQDSDAITEAVDSTGETHATTTSAAEESFEGITPQITAHEGAQDSLPDIQHSGAIAEATAEAVDSISEASIAPEASEDTEAIIPPSTTMEPYDSNSAEGQKAIIDDSPEEPLLAATEITSEAQQTSDKIQVDNSVESQVEKDLFVTAPTGEAFKTPTFIEAEVTVPVIITTPARTTRSRRPDTELRQSTRTSTRVTRRSLRQLDFPTTGFSSGLSLGTSPVKNSKRATRSPFKRVPLTIQENASESEVTAQSLSEQQESRQARPLKGSTESKDIVSEILSSETSRTDEPTMGEGIETVVAAEVEEPVAQSAQSNDTKSVEPSEMVAENAVAESVAAIKTSVVAKVSQGDVTEISTEQGPPTPENDLEPAPFDIASEDPTEDVPLPEVTYLSEDDLDGTELQPFEVLEPISLSLLQDDSTQDATDSEDDISADFTEDFTIDATIDLVTEAAQDEPSANLQGASEGAIDTTVDVTQDVTHEAVQGNFDSDDTDVLLKFLTRVKGEKAAQARKSTPKRKRSLPHSPIRLSLGEDDVDELASPEVVAKDDFDVSAPKEASNKRRKVERPESDQQDGSPPRRSGRTKTLKSKLPAPNFIPIHRDATVNLKKDAEKELAALTRNNTRKNKGAAVHPQLLLAKKAGGKESPVSRHKALKDLFNEKANRKKGKKPKTVVWAEELAHFQGKDKKEIPVEKKEATIRIEKGEKMLEKKAEPVKELEKEKPEEPKVAFSPTPAPASEEKRTPAKKSSIPRVSMKSKIALGMAVNGTPAPKRMMRKR